MIDNPMLLASTGCLVGAFVSFCLFHFGIYAELRQARRETSRFPMFAARDLVVNLVLDGDVNEQDLAWQRLYRNVNFFLSMHQNLHVLDCTWRYLRRVAQIAADPKLKKYYADGRLRQDRKAAQLPAFKAAVLATNSAFTHIVERRSNMWHVTCVWMLLVVVRFVLTAVSHGLKGGLRVARVFIRSAEVKPSAATDLAIWGDATCPHPGQFDSSGHLAA